MCTHPSPPKPPSKSRCFDFLQPYNSDSDTLCVLQGYCMTRVNLRALAHGGHLVHSDNDQRQRLRFMLWGLCMCSPLAHDEKHVLRQHWELVPKLSLAILLSGHSSQCLALGVGPAPQRSSASFSLGHRLLVFLSPCSIKDAQAELF